MYYVELLRVLRALRIVGLILGAILLIALIARPFSHSDFEGPRTIGGVDTNSIPMHKNPDGTSSKTFVGKNGERITMTWDKQNAETITVDKLAAPRAGHAESVRIGPIQVHSYRRGGHRIDTITHDANIPLFVLLLIASGPAAIVATVFGLALSRENDGHLELAWTKPVSRGTYAFGAMAVDIAGILAVGAAGLLLILAVLGIYGGLPYVRPGQHVPETLAFTVFFALGFYGIVLAATSSMRRGSLVLSILWPVALILPGLVRVHWMSLGTIARVLNTLNPVAYFYAYASSSDATQFFTLLPNGFALEIFAPLALFAAGAGLALAQWRRLEA